MHIFTVSKEIARPPQKAKVHKKREVSPNHTTSCWILSLCSAIKGCISETFSLDEHFQVQRLLIKYWSLNDKIPQNYTFRQLRRIPKKTFHFHFHAPWLILHIRTTTRSQRLLASRTLPPIITQMFEIKPLAEKFEKSFWARGWIFFFSFFHQMQYKTK